MKEASESNSGVNASQRNSAGRLKDGRAHNNESPTINLQDSTAEDEGVTDGKNFSQIIISEAKETNSGEKSSQSK